MSDNLLQLLTAYVDGELSSRQRKQIARLLEKSAEARKMLRRLRADRDVLRSFPRVQLGEGFAERIVSKLKPYSARPISAKANVFKIWWPAAAAAAIIIGIGLGTSVLLQDLMRGKRTPDNIIAKTQPDAGEKVASESRVPESPDEQGSALAKNDAPTADDLNRFSRMLEGMKGLLKPLGDGARQMVPTDAPKLALLPNFGGGQRPGGGLEFSDPPAVLTFPPSPPASAFKTIDSVTMALFLDPKNIDSTKLAERLKQDPIHHVDLACFDSAKTFERLQTACRVAGIRLIIDSELTQRLAKKQTPPVMLYLENTNPDLVLKLMNALKDQEVKAETAKKGDSVIDSIMVQPLDEAGRKRLADSLGVAPTTLTPMPASSPSPGKTSPAGLDPTKPIADGTIKSLEKLASKGKEPTAVALVYYPNRSRVPPSKELKQFQDGRVGLESGAIHVVFFLRVSRS